MNRVVEAFGSRLSCLWFPIIVFGCTRDPQPTNTRSSTTSVSRAVTPAIASVDTQLADARESQTCVAQLRPILVEGDLSQYHGLPSDCRLADIESILGDHGVSGEGKLSGKWRRWVKFPVPRWSTEARAWMSSETNAQERVILLEVKNPRMKTSPEALQHRFGGPAASMPARLDARNVEWLHPAHGLTVAVGTYGDPRDARARITYLFLYTPSTMNRYVEELGGKDEWVRRWPQSQKPTLGRPKGAPPRSN
ncbi:MAG: hypothetical protein QM784_22720 [Polyangiaceae bacterium]